MLTASPSAPVDEKGVVDRPLNTNRVVSHETASDVTQIPAGMTRWHGGDSAPEDMDPNGQAMMADGDVLKCEGIDDIAGLDWMHIRRGDGSLECWCIIAYTATPRTDAKS